VSLIGNWESSSDGGNSGKARHLHRFLVNARHLPCLIRCWVDGTEVWEFCSSFTTISPSPAPSIAFLSLQQRVYRLFMALGRLERSANSIAAGLFHHDWLQRANTFCFSVITHSSGEVNTNTKFGSDVRGFVFGRAGYVVESGVLDWPKEQRRQQEILGWQAPSTQSKSSGSWGAGIISIHSYFGSDECIEQCTERSCKWASSISYPVRTKHILLFCSRPIPPPEPGSLTPGASFRWNRCFREEILPSWRFVHSLSCCQLRTKDSVDISAVDHGAAFKWQNTSKFSTRYFRVPSE
jgi:hypothetical protein